MDTPSESAAQSPVHEADADKFVWTTWHVLGLTVLCLAQLFEALDMTVVNVALPTIRTGLHFSADNLQWVVNAYTVLFGGFLLLGGRTGDLIGRRRVFMSGMLLFTLASLGAGFSPNAASLVMARGVQGLAAGFVSPMTLAMIASIFPQGPARNRALALWGMTTALSASLGLIIGGALVDGPGWRWIFFINLPVGLFLLTLSPRALPVDRPARRHRHFDIAGAVACTAGVCLLVYAIAQTSSNPWSSPGTIGMLAGAAALLGYFIVHETVIATDPLVDFSLFRVRALAGANGVQALTAVALYTLFYLTSLYMQTVLRYSALKTGLAYLPLTIAMVIFAGLAPLLIPRLGVRFVLVIGALASGAGLMLFSRISPAGGLFTDIALPSLVVGVGISLMFIPLTIAGVSGVPAERHGIASALLNVSRTVGGALGLAIISTVATSRIEILLHTERQLTALSDGYRLGFAVGAGVMVATAFIALLVFRGEGRGQKIDPAELSAIGLDN